MGYWAEREATNETPLQVWGDSPADAMDDALAKVVKVFKRDIGRNPTAFELERGLQFALCGARGCEEYPPS